VTDPLDRFDELGRRMLLIPEASVFARRTVATAFGVLAAMVAVAVGLLIGITSDTNRIVDERTAELEQTIADQQAVIGQAVDGILLQNQMLRDAGIEPPEIVLLPPDEGD
jgi:hypothetical protein